MSSLFLSHSSKDDAFAADLRLKLEEQGHRSVFLDFDPEDGIPAGRDWEQELYRNLRRCRGMIVLCSPHLMSSRWCFAEITHAKSLGKPLFPIKIAPCEIDSLLTSGQIIDFTQDPAQAYRRLWRGLVIAGLDPANAFDWDGGRPPFPGLLAFREEDAAIFFGRDSEIQQGLEGLQRQRQFGGTRLLMVLGASGSGKSSLVKAGLMPRLRRDLDSWLPLDSFRPGNDPLRALAVVLSKGFEQAGRRIDWRSLRQRLADAAPGPGASPNQPNPAARNPAYESVATAVKSLESALRAEPNDEALRYLDLLSSAVARPHGSNGSVPAGGKAPPPATGNALLELATDLRILADRPEARVLVVIDQFEELLGRSAEHPANHFLELLRVAVEHDDTVLQVVGTMRSDYLGSFQKTRSLADLQYDTLSVGPMSSDGVAQTILKPAALAALDLEPGLVEALVEDAKDEDSLPLLAFTMRKLWERHGGDGVLTIEEYRDRLGGLSGAVATVADATLSTAGLRRDQEKDLRRSFLSMARINEEGRFARRQALWRDLPNSVHEVLEQFVQARLLVSRDEGDDRVLEVAHEALFASWGLLRSWLDQDREFLLWRKRLLTAQAQWHEAGRDEGALLRGVLLTEAENWMAERPEDLAEERLFIEASTGFRTRKETIEKLRKRRVLVSLGAAALIFLTLATLAWRESLKSRRTATEMRAGLIVRTTRTLRDPALRALLLVEAADLLDGREPTGGARAAREVFGLAISQAELSGHLGPVSTVAFSPDDSRVVTASNDGTARIWRTDGFGVPLILQGPGSDAVSARFSPDGKQVVAAFADGSARIWSSGGARLLASLEGHDDKLWSAEFSHDGSRVVTASADGTARVWTIGSENPVILRGHLAAVRWAGFSPNDKQILTVSEDGTARLWLASGRGESEVAARHSDWVWQGGFSTDGSKIVTASRDGTAQICPADRSSECVVLASHSGWVWTARFSHDGTRVVTASADNTARLWTIDGAESAVMRGHADWVRDAVFGPADSKILTVSHDGDGGIWKTDNPRALMPLDGHEGWVRGAAFSHDGARVATASDDDDVRIWSSDSAVDPRILTGHEDQIWTASFRHDDARVITSSADLTARIWDAKSGRELVALRGHEQRVRSATFSPDGKRALTASDDGTARLWNADGSGQPVILTGHRGKVLDANFSHDGTSVVTASYDSTIGLWDTEGRRLRTLEGHSNVVRSAAFSRDDSKVLSASADGTARLWDLRSPGQPIEFRGHTNQVTTAAFNHDESKIVTASFDRTARIWNADGSGEAIILEGHEGLVWSAAFSPDGTKVVTASTDRTARVWNADGSGDPITLQSHSGPVWNAVFSHEGGRIATASADSTARLWNLWRVEWPQLVGDLRRQTTACITPPHRRRYLSETASEAVTRFEACEKAFSRTPPGR